MLSAANFVFGSIMSRQMGEMDYGPEERLNYGATGYPERSDTDTEFHLISVADTEEERFDRTEKLLERVLRKNNTLDGEEVLDNQDLCLLLKVGIRTLQRYRAIGVLPYFTISGKVFYRTKDVHEFIRTRFADVEERAAKRKEKEARKEERRRKRGLFP